MPLLSVPGKRWGVLFVICAALAWSWGVLNIPSKWWFEDDPGLYYRVGVIANPIDIFINLDVIHRFGVGKALVPMQILSYWLDMHLFGPDPRAAYLHSLVSFTVTSLVIYLLLQELTHSTVAAAGGALLWMLLPSTLATHYFISARHYIEGLSWSLLACILAIRFCAASNRRLLLLGCVALLGVCAVLSKEIYATTLPTFLFVLGVYRRRFVLSILAVLLVAGYSAYRFAVLGSDLTYTEPLLGFSDYMRFLAVLPYTFSSGFGGYVLYIAVGVLATALVWCQPPEWATTVAALLVLLAALVAIYAVAYPVLVTYTIPGTWYRVPFIINSLLIVWASYIIGRLHMGRLQIAVLAIIGLLVLPGTLQTRQLWNERMARAEIEGRFYLAYPDRLLYSEEDAWWFIPGVHELYHVAEPHYINKNAQQGVQASIMIQTYPTIWRYSEGAFIADNALYNSIKQEDTP